MSGVWHRREKIATLPTRGRVWFILSFLGGLLTYIGETDKLWEECWEDAYHIFVR